MNQPTNEGSPIFGCQWPMVNTRTQRTPANHAGIRLDASRKPRNPTCATALAREYSALSLENGFEREQLRELKESRWRDALNLALLARGLSIENFDVQTQPLEWKLQMATELRRQVDAPYRWIAQALNIEHASSLRMQVHRRALHVSA